MQKCVDVVLKTPVFMLKSPVLILKFLVSLIKFLVGRSNPRFSWLHSCPQSTTCRHVPHLCAPAGPNSTLGFHKDATCHQHHDVTPVCDEKFTKFTPCLVNLYIYIVYISCISLVTRGHLKTWYSVESKFMAVCHCKVATLSPRCLLVFNIFGGSLFMPVVLVLAVFDNHFYSKKCCLFFSRRDKNPWPFLEQSFSKVVLCGKTTSCCRYCRCGLYFKVGS
jgi:hypothetical protein